MGKVRKVDDQTKQLKEENKYIFWNYSYTQHMYVHYTYDMDYY